MCFLNQTSDIYQILVKAPSSDLVLCLRTSGDPKIARKASNWLQSPFVVLVISAGLACHAAGCRGRAHEDLYRAKMANEIRVREDQLYDADYQNRILRDELNRARESHRPENTVPLDDTRGSATGPSFKPGEYELLDPESLVPEALVPEALQPYEPNVDDGQSGGDSSDDTSPRGLPTPPPMKSPAAAESNGGNATENGDAPAAPAPLTDPPTNGLGMPSAAVPTPVPTPVPDESNNPAMDLPPPSELPAPARSPGPPELIPPAEGELMDDQIIPGPPTPPDDDPSSPPGKIPDPKDAKTMGFDIAPDEPLQIPDHLELHDGISGGHQFDSDNEIDGMYLVVQVADEAGTPLSMGGFDVDAELTVVVFDPNDQSEDARVGRWDFKPEEVRKMVRQAPVDGIHIPITWQDRIPQSDDVIVHVRLAAAEEEMRCQGRIRLEETVAVSDWLPRG